MSIPDGEYDIDISSLRTAQPDDTFGIRYGVLPDSMDKNSPLTLYDDTKNLILEARSMRDDDVIFEGMKQVSSSKDSASGNFYLEFENGQVKLSNLTTTIRFNRSRNSIKWRNMIQKWNNEVKATKDIQKDIETHNDFPEFQLEFDDDNDDFADMEEAMNSVLETSNTTKPKPKVAPVKVTAKAPPPRTEKLPKPQKAKVPTSRTAKKSVPVTSKQKVESSIEDEFGDLENELQEVLGDSDSDDDYEGFSVGPIEVIDNTKAPSSSRSIPSKNMSSNTANKRPTSLRAFMGDTKRDDDGSSSEEE